MQNQLKKHKPAHTFFLNSILQGNLIYFLMDFTSNRNLKPLGLMLVFVTGFISMNFLINDIMIPKLFHYDPQETQLPILNEFLLFQSRFFKIHFLKRIFYSEKQINFINDSSNYSKELMMDVKIKSME